MSKESFFRVVDRKQNASAPAIPYEIRPPAERITDFQEICSFSPESAMAEASRCIQCPDPQPCLQNCPMENNIPDALWEISQGNFTAAAEIFAETSTLPEICGPSCPGLCMSGCVLQKRNGAANIPKLEMFAADAGRKTNKLTISTPVFSTGKRVAIVGSGPAGLTAAEKLHDLGHDVSIFESCPESGGMLLYGIPNFKLEKSRVRQKINDLTTAGIQFYNNVKIGSDLQLLDLQSQYDAIFLGTGAGRSASFDLPGEKLTSVWRADRFLAVVNAAQNGHHSYNGDQLPNVGQSVAVIGGGDTAVDCARSAIRLGAKHVRIIYRRTEAEMPGSISERTICRDEGVSFHYLLSPLAYLPATNNPLRVGSIKLQAMQLGAPDNSGRRRPEPIPGDEILMPVDTVILALGYWPDPLLSETTPTLATDRWGLITADKETGAANIRGIFAGGDNVHGPDLVVTAMRAGRDAARAIDVYLHQLPGKDD